MKMQSRFGLATVVLLVMPTFSQAQHATGSFQAAPSAPARAPVAHTTAVHAHTGNRMNSARAVRAWSPAGMNAPADLVGANGLSARQGLNPFLNNGFGERHRHRKPKTGEGFIFLDGVGAYLLPVDAGTDVNQDGDAQVAQDQGQGQDQGQSQGTPQERAQDRSQQQEQAESSNDARLAQEQSESLPDEGEFTLILRSGQEIEAVAFTRVNDRIVYITTGGGRRTVAVRELDIDATVRLNQERGTPLQIPL
jgi:hypothetical protein